MATQDFEAFEGRENIWPDLADEKAKSILIDRCSHIVRIVAARIPKAFRQDVIQDAWVRVFSVIPLYNPRRATIEAVVQGCARLAVAEFWRQYYRSPTNFVDGASEMGDSFEDLPLSASASDSPEIQTERLALIKFVVQIGMGRATPPHHSIVFAYKKLLDWTNDEIIRKRESSFLKRCGPEVWASFVRNFPGYRDWCDPVFQDFVVRLSRSLADLLTSAKSREPYKHLLDRPAEDTRIADYFERSTANRDSRKGAGLSQKEKSDQLALWWFSVRRRILDAVAAQAAQNWLVKGHANDE